MKRLLRVFFPIILAIAILASIGWYLFVYDTAFTREFLIHQARWFEKHGYYDSAVWLYNLTYEQFGNNDEVIIELVEHYIEVGDYARAENTLRRAISDKPTATLYIALCDTYVQQGKLRDAVLLLENVNEEIRMELEPLRPAPPYASLPSGNYHQYMPVEIISDGNSIYASTDGDYPSAEKDAYTGPIVLADGETTIFAVSVAENGLVSPLMVFNYIVTDVVQEVTFTDAAFEAAVREQLGYGENQVIYSNNLWLVTELDIPSQVQSIRDLSWFPNLEKLSITGSALNDYEALGTLDKLKSLTISETIVSSNVMACIGKLTGLEELTLSNCALSSVADLDDLVNLRRLVLSDNAIRNISGLAGMTKLQYLDLRSNALINLDSLSGLTELEYLDVSFNSLQEVQPLSNLTKLTYLDISCNVVRKLDGMETLVALTEFYASYNELVDIDPLADCTKLKILVVAHNTLVNVDPTASMTLLEEFDFSHNDVTQLPKYSTKCALRIIEGSYNNLSNLKNLAGLVNIELIYMNYNEEITGVNSLIACTKLKELHIYGTSVRSVSRLTEKGILVVYSPA